MYKITEKVALNPTVTKMVIEAPLIAKKAKPGQFIIVRPFEDSERIPLTVAGYDREKGTVDIIFQIVGGTSTSRAASSTAWSASAARTCSSSRMSSRPAATSCGS